MRTKTSFLGHAIHPMLVAFPIGLLGTSVVFDIVHLFTGTGLWAEIAFWLIASGVVGGLVAAVFGFLDWLAIESGTRAKTVGLWHGILSVVAVALFSASWIVRLGTAGDPGSVAVSLSLAGVVTALVSAWLGGELVQRLGVGVHEGAHLNSPSSLSVDPASDGAEPSATAKRGSTDGLQHPERVKSTG